MVAIICHILSSNCCPVFPVYKPGGQQEKNPVLIQAIFIPSPVITVDWFQGKLPENIGFTLKYHGFPVWCSHHPVPQFRDSRWRTQVKMMKSFSDGTCLEHARDGSSEKLWDIIWYHGNMGDDWDMTLSYGMLHGINYGISWGYNFGVRVMGKHRDILWYNEMYNQHYIPCCIIMECSWILKSIRSTA